MQTSLRMKNLKMFKGLRNYEENNSVNTDQVYSAQNARFGGFVMTSRKGNQALGDELTGGTEFKGLYEYPYFSDGTTTKRLLGFYNKIFRQYNETTDVWDTISTTWSDVADEDTGGVLYNNVMYFVNPMDDSGTATTYTPAFLTSGSNATAVVGDWADVNNGSVRITIDGTLRSITGLNFTNVVTMDDVALVIQTGIRAATSSSETVVWDVDHFIITSANTTSSSAMTVTTAGAGGTDISGAGAGLPYMDSETGHGTVTAAVASWPGVGKISNTTFSVVANSPRGTAIESWVERLWVIGDYDAPNSVIASRASTASNPLNIEDWQNGVLLELIGKGGKCAAIRVLNNELFIWKQDSVWYNTPDRIAAGESSFIELSRTGGTISQKTTVVVENDVWFLTPELEIRSLGLERQLGNNPRTRELSSVISRSMALLDPDQSNASLSYNKRIVKVQLRTKDAPTNNFTIVFDYDTGGFSIDKGPSVEKSVVWDGDLVYTEDSSVGQAYKDDSGYTANGISYTFDVKTPFLDDGRPDTSKRARYIYFRGQQSFEQEIKVRLYRDANYSTYSEYTIQSPSDRGVSAGSNVNDGQQGSREYGDAQFGGDGETSDDILMYRTQSAVTGDWLISVDRRSNMFAIGVNAIINGGKVIVEQLGLKVIDDNENYKVANQ